MKTVKGLLLGSAAGLVAITGAQAADLPLAEPVEYVKVCSTYGNGYFYIPGTNTCLRISGFARVDIRAGSQGYRAPVVDSAGDVIGRLENDTFAINPRGRVTFDARSETEWGTLRGVVQFDNGANGGTGANVRNAFIQFAGVTAGRVQSFYDFVPYNHFGDFFSDQQVDTLAYTFGFGSGFSATIALEDKTFNRELGTTADSVGLYDLLSEGGNRYPNLVAALRVDQAWGSAQLSGALQNNRAELADILGSDFSRDNEWGWAVQAGASLNLPWSEGSLIWVQGAYTEGALSYIGADIVAENSFNAVIGPIPGAVGLGNDFGLSAGGSISNVEAWQIGAGFGYAFSPAVSFNVGATYLDVDSAGDGVLGAGVTPSYDITTVLANVIWAPVENLNIGLEAVYQKIDVAELDGSDDTWSLRTRIQRNF